jgi:hypothetical protein
MLNGLVFFRTEPFLVQEKKFQIEPDFAWILKGSENGTRI